MFGDFDTQIQIEEVVRDDIILIEPEDYYKFCGQRELMLVKMT